MAKPTAKKKAVAAPYPTKIVRPEEGNIAGIFSAIQGEGTLVGERQLFIRMGGCPLRCHYCDTPEALIPSPVCRIEENPGSMKFRRRANPVPPQELAAIVTAIINLAPMHRAITLTGGEPLWQAAYLSQALPLLRGTEKRIYLETAGAHVEELKQVLPHVDVVAMDMKPPSSTAMKPLWAQHREFLRVALAKQVIIKVTVTRTTTLADLELVREMVAEVDRTLPVVLQPVTPAWKVRNVPMPAQLYQWQAILSEKLSVVRVIPQCQHILGGP